MSVRIPSDPDKGRSTFGDLLRLQTEFQARLAEETLKYLRSIQGAAAPASPGTVLLTDGDAALEASGAPGASVLLSLEIENRQRVHCVVTPLLSPLVESSGTTWFPAAEPEPASSLLAPGEVRELALRVPLPAALPRGTYRGALILQGFREGGVPVSISVKPRAAARKRRTTKRT